MLNSISIVSLLSYFLLGVIGWITYKIFIWPHYVSPLRKIPGPPSENPFLGNIKTFMKEDSGEPQLRWIKKYGNIIKVHGIFNEPIVFVADPKIIQDISVTRAYDFIKPPGLLADSIAVAGRGLLIWKIRRTNLELLSQSDKSRLYSWFPLTRFFRTFLSPLSSFFTLSFSFFSFSPYHFTGQNFTVGMPRSFIINSKKLSFNNMKFCGWLGIIHQCEETST
ncbi:hypothetical protein C1646_664698 [Rhizophagus diaphanus]|nr:hypothetical protein C1646_664698 [Rhizophagus diaphanus] [Rhizophagus sp. MUCL 43196]